MTLGNIDLPGVSTSFASIVDSASLAVQGFDIVMLVTPDDWTPGAADTFAAQQHGSDNAQRAWNVGLNIDGTLKLSGFFAAGSQVRASSIATGFTDATPAWLRFTFNPANREAKFYTSLQNPCLVGTDTDPRAAVTWAQLGTTSGTAAAVTVNDSSEPIKIGMASTFEPYAGLFHLFALYNGYDGAGSLVSLLDVRDPDTIVDPSGDEWTDAVQVNNWTLTGAGWSYTAGSDCPLPATVDATYAAALPELTQDADTGMAVEVIMG